RLRRRMRGARQPHGALPRLRLGVSRVPAGLRGSPRQVVRVRRPEQPPLRAIAPSAWATDHAASRLTPLPQPEREVLDLEVLLDAPMPAFAPDPRLLEAAERRL